MAQMERIVRPHLPATVSPAKEPPKCREEAKNNVIIFEAPAGLSTGVAATPVTPAGGGGGGSPPQDNNSNQTNTQKKTYNSSWAYAYKKYMTKVEKEQDKCKEDDEGEDRVTGGQVTDKQVEGDSASGGEAGGEGGGEGPGGEGGGGAGGGAERRV